MDHELNELSHDRIYTWSHGPLDSVQGGGTHIFLSILEGHTEIKLFDILLFNILTPHPDPLLDEIVDK